MSIICYRWVFADILWKNADWTWSECQIIQDLISIVGDRPGVDATTLIQPWLLEPHNPYRTGEKKKRLIKLICKVKGIEYEETKESKDFNVSVDDIKLVIAKGREIGIDITRE